MSRVREAQEARGASATSSSTSDDNWVGTMLVFRELYKMPASLHPYASYDATADELEKLNSGEIKAFIKKWYTPKAATLVLTGPVEATDVRAAIDKAFGSWKGTESPGVGIGNPSVPEGTRIYVADRPGTTQCQVFLAAFGPQRNDTGKWAATAAGWQILGGGRAGKLESDLREKRSLVLSARTTVPDVAAGPQPLIVRADVSTAKLGRAVEGILAHLQRATDQAPKDDDVTAARRFLTDALATQWGSPGGIADGIALTAASARADDDADSFVKALAKVDSFTVAREMAGSVGGGHVLVVVGDASKIATTLTHFGEVAVVNPVAGFARTQSMTMNEKAPLEPSGEKQ
ncbi:MAG: insulinase family protein [Polyangiaceae bacterium]